MSVLHSLCACPRGSLKVSLLFGLVACAALHAQSPGDEASPIAPSGSLAGIVTDLTTAQPLVGANILIEGTELGAATDNRGHYTIPAVPVGSYTVRVAMMGYRPQSRANVHIVPQRETALNFALEVQAVLGQEIVVTGRFFERARDAVVSARSVDIEEIRSDPAGAYDIQRMMEALPAVVLGSDQHNEIIVRGGGMGENLFIMDHLEIPNPNHFGELGASGGAINVINTDFIERIDFYAGAFPARYGERLSSVMDITLREGNRQRFQSQLEMSMAGFGAAIEGPLWDGRGSYLGSYRKSFLDLVIRDVGLTAVPHFSNWQAKMALDLSPGTKLLFNVLGGMDNIELEGSTIPQTRGIDNILADGGQHAYGITLKSLLSKNGYSLLSLSQTQWFIHYQLYNYLPSNAIQMIYDLDDTISDWMLKGDLNYRINQSVEVALGFNHKWRHLVRDSIVGPDTLWTYRYGIEGIMEPSYLTTGEYYDLILNDPGKIIVQDDTWLAVRTGSTIDTVYASTSLSAYGQLKWRPTLRWEVILGLRHYRVAVNEAADWAPRIGLAFALTDRTRLNFAFGRHFQMPAYYQVFHNSSDIPRNTTTGQLVAGLEHHLADDTRGTLEIYHKSYDNLVLELAETTLDTSDIYGGFVNAGEGYARGLELFLQKKFTRRWYGSFSFSRYRSLARDPREGLHDRTYPRSSDYRQLLTIIGGYKLKFMERSRYLQLKKRSWWPCIAWLPFLPADELEVSFRYREVGRRPYTHKVYNATVRRWFMPMGGRINSQRLDAYKRFDVMILRRFYFRKINIVTFVDIQNLFDRDNPWDLIYYQDGSEEVALQYRQFPVGGILLEF